MISNYCLKTLLLDLISPEQTGNVEGWQFLDNIILSHEAIHSLKINKTPGMLKHSTKSVGNI